VCCGNSSFLKSLYGVGYSLTVTRGGPDARMAERERRLLARGTFVRPDAKVGREALAAPRGVMTCARVQEDDGFAKSVTVIVQVRPLHE
jgi:hypothetical protein